MQCGRETFESLQSRHFFKHCRNKCFIVVTIRFQSVFIDNMRTVSRHVLDMFSTCSRQHVERKIRLLKVIGILRYFIKSRVLF